MGASNFWYLIKEGARNIRSNKLMSAASIGVLVACMLLVGASLLLTANINSLVGYVEQQNEVVVFLVDGISEITKDGIQDQLSADPNIFSITYVSKEEGLQEWIASLGDGVEPEVFAELYSDNVLPDSFRVKISDLSTLDDTILRLKSIPGVESVSAPVEVAQTVTHLKQVVLVVSIGIIALLVIVATVIIANTIKLTIFNRRREINIMKFVGATNTFIRVPYVVEGFLLGLIAAVLAFFILWGAYYALIHWMTSNPTGWLEGIAKDMISFKDIAWQLLGAFSAFGVVIGTFGSLFFVRKYLRV